MSVKIHGKEYRTVAERVNLFHEEHKDVIKSIKTKILLNNDKFIAMRTTVKVGDCVYHGHAQEVYGSTQVNETSALENCETSAIGRALASAGFGGTEFASADEVANAISQQNIKASVSSSNGQVQSNESYVHNDDVRNSAITFGKHKGELWKDLPKDYITWLANNSDNVKMANYGGSRNYLEHLIIWNLRKKQISMKRKEIQREMQLSSEPSLELGVDDDLPF